MRGRIIFVCLIWVNWPLKWRSACSSHTTANACLCSGPLVMLVQAFGQRGMWMEGPYTFKQIMHQGIRNQVESSQRESSDTVIKHRDRQDTYPLDRFGRKSTPSRILDFPLSIYWFFLFPLYDFFFPSRRINNDCSVWIVHCLMRACVCVFAFI